MTLEGGLANAADLWRLHKLEMCGYFEAGFTVLAMVRADAYLKRIAWLKLRRLLPGAPPYPGPSLTDS